MIDGVIDLITLAGGMSKTEAEKQISAGWTDGVMYRGINVFDTVYNSGVTKGAIWRATESFLPESNQECYLGYIADQDRFIVGFDTWPHDGDDGDDDDEDDDGGYGPDIEVDEGSDSVLFFTLTPEGKITNVEPVPDMERMFYHNNLNKLHELYPTLYDIRLD